jgi:hypothetical protein
LIHRRSSASDGAGVPPEPTTPFTQLLVTRKVNSCIVSHWRVHKGISTCLGLIHPHLRLPWVNSSLCRAVAGGSISSLEPVPRRGMLQTPDYHGAMDRHSSRQYHRALPGPQRRSIIVCRCVAIQIARQHWTTAIGCSSYTASRLGHHRSERSVGMRHQSSGSTYPLRQS